MSSNNIDNIDEDKNAPRYHQHTGGMTPSIITTINNTSPTPLIADNHGNEAINLGSDLDSSPKSRRPVEPYESYIEDSFVGHWEREDDDPEYDYKLNGGPNDAHRCEDEDESMVHPSTIEFDFDSFGPESFIYTPPAAAAAAAAKPTTQVESLPDPPPSDKTPEAMDPVPESEPVPVDKKEEPDVAPETRAKPVNPRNLCALKPSPIDYLVDPSQIDLKVIEPYKKVISHAGYCHHFDSSVPQTSPSEPAPAIIVFSACYLPDRSRRDYDYVMDHLFLYVLSSLHELIADDYILIYLHNTQPSTTTSINLSRASSSSNSANGSSTNPAGGEELHQNNLPTFTWMKRCYQMIDRKLRKNLRILYLVKPTFWLKTIVIMCKPFISSKFSRKLRFIENMDALKKCLPVDQLILPASAENL